MKEIFLKLLKICVSQLYALSFKSFKDFPAESLFKKFIVFIQEKMHCNFLAKKLITWFNEKYGKSGDEFTFRFRGK